MMEKSSALAELAGVLFACRDLETLRKTFVARVALTVGARAGDLWLTDPREEGLRCRAQWTDAAERLTPVKDGVADGILAAAFEDASPIRLSGKELERDSFTQFPASQRATIQTALLVPFPGETSAAGVVEVLNRRDGTFTADDAAFLEAAARLASQADALLAGIETERHLQLETVERLTALYDIARIFNSTLEIEALLPIVASKVRDILRAQACNLWLVEPNGGSMKLAQQDGRDPTVEVGAEVPIDSGHLANVAQTGNPRLIENPADEEALAERLKAGGEDFEIQSLIGAPLTKETQVIGVIELVNKSDGTPFNEDDLFFLASIAEQAAVALHNANLLESERKLHTMHALLKISQEITSTLDLDHVLTTVVHQASTAVPFDRCAIGFFDRNKFVLGAVSGEAEVPKNDEMTGLRKLLEWVSTQQTAVRADQYEEGWEVDPESAQPIIVPYLEENGVSGFYALPLRDDQGTVGVLCLQSDSAEFLNEGQRETVAILANQTTVAIRNAQLYQQVPLAGLLQPFAQKKKKFIAAMPTSRWIEYGRKTAVVAAILLIVPWPMRVSTNATVVPAQRRMISAITGGIVQRVFVHEGDMVTRGQILAQLDDSDARLKLNQAQTDFALAQRGLAQAESRRDLTVAAQSRLHASMAQAEMRLETERVADAQLRAPIDGVVITPKIEEKTGVMLQPGDPLCELVEQQRMAVDMNVPETDMALIRQGDHVALKLNAFPTETFDGIVDRVGARSEPVEGEQFFVVRAVFENTQGLAKDGMAGRARILSAGGWFGTGWFPVGYALLRSPARWIWERIWVWLP
jgi:RND family efflux transporter MFP subunit